ncbi:MAG: transcription-repair coupling factor, partial [bacterium]
LNKKAIVVLDEPELIHKKITSEALQFDDYDLETVCYDSKLTEDGLWNPIINKVEAFRQVRFVSIGQRFSNLIDLNTKSQETFKGNLKLFKQFIESLHQKKLDGQQEAPLIVFLCDNRNHTTRMEEIFIDEGIMIPNFTVGTLGLHNGFIFPDGNIAVFTDHQFYGRTKRFRLPRKSHQGLSPKQLRYLNIGDYVVHVDFGIGVFRGLKKIEVRGHERECLHIEYKDGDNLYVRIERMDRVHKYSSKDGMKARLNKLGTADWQRLKNRTKKKIKDIAQELIEIYAKRKAQTGLAFAEDTLWQRELEASFPYQDTPDQLKATHEVKKDMESHKPMDRLVCGDVGFGKTEVAVRAAFKAVLSGKQVAMLVPTTILAYQHYHTFVERLQKFPIQVEMLSRFKTRAEQRKIIERLKGGQIDIVIGTHRILSNDISFKELGLLIIDEEQRFGVRHKERLKKLRTIIDVLTLTATPIPRTLYLSLMGARDITNINTPPRNRLPIVTEILPFNKPYIRDVILRELDRGGQVFFVHNRVRSIDRIATMLSALMPEANVAVAHGQMDEKALEQVMIEFMNKKHQILVSTMIIESGLDMPNVNTIIVNRADKLGLAQLYQLRGRVGRSHHRAYAYLLIPPIESLTEEALKRLRAIEEFSDIGSGSQLAMRDLEIRGAGNLLGAEQSGFIDALGFDLYNKILDEAVKELKMEQDPQKTSLPEFETQVEIDSDAYLPDRYIQSGSERVDIYRRLTECKTLEQMDDLRLEIVDRFGRLPEPVE